MPPALQAVLSWFGGGVAVIVGLTGVAYWLFKTFSTKWLESRFSTRLETYKHELTKVLEGHKHELSSLLDRATRLHAQEFEVLPNLWEKLATSMNSVLGVLSPLQLSGDVTHASAPELDAVLDKSPLLEHEKQAVRDAKTFDRSRVLHQYEMHYRRREAITAWTEFQRYATAKSIFIEPDLSTKIEELGRLIYSAFDEDHWSKMDPTDKTQRQAARAAYQKLTEDGVRLRKEIEDAVSSRLRAATTIA